MRPDPSQKNAGKTPQSSSLPLQMILYYNMLFSFVYWVLMAMIISTKLQYLIGDGSAIYGGDRQEVYIIACFILYTIGDLMRIPFALWGNQTEQVPALAAAALVTIFPTIPALVYLTFFQPKRFPFETIGGCVQFAFILFEFPLLWRSLQYNADVQHARFVRLTLQPEHED
tara:strand:- start:242 stop:754 length:513 start_codon:yes stop_codon:yes gene_type:complete